MSRAATTFDLRDMLSAQLCGIGDSAKEIARTCGVSPRSVEGWRAGGGISAEALIALCRRYPSIWREVCRAVGADRPAVLARLDELDREFAALRAKIGGMDDA